MAAGRWSDALRLAAKFSDLGSHRAVITRADASIKHPDFYRQLGQDPAENISAGILALKERYGTR